MSSNLKTNAAFTNRNRDPSQKQLGQSLQRQVPKVKFSRKAPTTPGAAQAPASFSAPPVSAPQGGASTAFMPPSDSTDPATANAQLPANAAPSVADPLSATGTDPYSSAISDGTGSTGTGFKKGGLVKSKRRGWGIARG